MWQFFLTFGGSLTFFFSHLMIPSSHCAVPISHMTVLLSHWVVSYFFSHTWRFHPHIVQFQHYMWQFFGGSLTFFLTFSVCLDSKSAFPSCVLFLFFSFFFFFLFSRVLEYCGYCSMNSNRKCWLSAVNSAHMHCLRTHKFHFFINFFIKNGSHITIHIFKNYFATVFSVFSFQFQQNKFYPNTPLMVSFSHYAVPTSNVTFFFSHLVVFLLFSHIWRFHPYSWGHFLDVYIFIIYI